MATIGKIREKSGLAIGIIGLAMLGFIATDLLKSRNIFGGGSSAHKGIGSIFGEEIEPQTFQDRYNEMVKAQRMNSKGADISVDQLNQINDQVWQQLTNDVVMDHESKILGLQVTGQEIFDLCVGPYPDQLAIQAFYSNPKQKASKQDVKRFIENINDAKPEQQEFWAGFEPALVSQRIASKYKTMVQAAVYSTNLEMEDNFYAKNKNISIQFVPLSMNSIPDSTIAVSESEIKDYYNKHKDLDYKRDEPARTIEMVSFDDRPSKQDTMDTYKAVLALKTPFKETTDDSSFVVNNGTGTFSNTYEHRGSFPANIEDSIFAKKDSEFIGPFYEDSAYKLVKIIGHKDDTVMWYHASHILIEPSKVGDPKQDSIEAYNKAEKLYEDAKKPGADFAAMAMQNSQDPGSGGKGGDLGWFKDHTMVKGFMGTVEKGVKGGIYIVSSQFGTHVIKITDAPTKKLVKAGILVKPVVVGTKTNNDAYGEAVKFRRMAQDAKTFDDASKSMNLTKRVIEKIKPNQHDIAGLINPRELIRWAYKDDTKEGSVSDPMRITDRYVVAKMVKIYPDGYAPLDDVKDEIKKLVQRDKKKQMLADKLKAAEDKSKSLEDIAKAVGSTVNTADGITFENPNIQGLANEPIIAGAVTGCKNTNVVSPPISGMNVVLVFKITNVNSIKAPTNFDRDRKMAMDREKGAADGEAKAALDKLADIKDYRYLYY